MNIDTRTENAKSATVSTLDELFVALEDDAVETVALVSDLVAVPSFVLPPGKALEGRGTAIRIAFTEKGDGLVLTRDNRLANVRLETESDRCAILNDTSVPTLGRMYVRDVTTVGRVRILARDSVRSGHVEIDGLDIISADARAETERPHGFGVYVTQGAFTLWNMHTDSNVQITANLLRMGAGREKAPVRGSGIFVSGADGEGGGVRIERLETAAVYSDGGIAPGTPDQISGGVFTVYGCHARSVRNHGPVTTYGPNDMVLDNWGEVDLWIAHAPVTSFGPSAIGFVNFGRLKALRCDAPIETFGQGARGFNVYDGTADFAEFDRIVTHGDGAVGIQISKPIGRLRVRNGIETFGGTGDSLVKGVVTSLPAIALSVKPGGRASAIDIAGGLKTNVPGISPLEMLGSVSSLRVDDISTAET
jgi:hypothetical protein